MPWQLGTITGKPNGKGLISLGDRSILTIRAQESDLEGFRCLDNQSLTIGHHAIKLQCQEVRELVPVSELSARIVIIKGCQEPQAIYNSLALRIKGAIKINNRLTLKIKRFTVVGFGVTLKELTPSESLRLQSEGVGGKPRMGAGFLVGN